MVEGLDEGRWALLSKVHHCMVDGVAATDLMSVMFDDSGEPAEPDAWEPGPEPSSLEILTRSVASRTLDPAAQLRSALARRSELIEVAASTARAIAATAPALRPATSSLTGPIGPTGSGRGPTPSFGTSRPSVRRSEARSTTSCWR